VDERENGGKWFNQREAEGSYELSEGYRSRFHAIETAVFQTSTRSFLQPEENISRVTTSLYVRARADYSDVNPDDERV